MGDFELYKNRLLKARLWYAIVLMAIPALLLFSALDYLLAPDQWFLFFLGRIATCLILLGIVYLNKRVESRPEMTPRLAYLGTLVIGVAIGFMTSRTGGLESPYVAGLNWIAIGSLAFFPATSRNRLIIIATIYGPCILFETFLGFHPFGINGIIAATFLCGTVVLSWVMNVVSLDAIQEEFRLRFKLEDLVQKQERVIAVKSEEAANLKRLTKQFSPAVIEAIETKAITLNERARKKVAIIFMDVVGSTNRSTSLDYNDYQAALDMFFDIAIKKLLARNITVANFMGDGLMAIANAPYQLHEYERIAYEAGIEILEETFKRRQRFRELWKDDFHVRVGISSGFANVGFFPNTDFGVYTAIGDSVNLASRLCTATHSSTLATTKNILVSAESSIERSKVALGGTISALKGFSGHNLEYFIVLPKMEEIEQMVRQQCPLCAGELKKSADLGDCILVKCVSCSYTDVQPIVSAAEPKRLAG